MGKNRYAANNSMKIIQVVPSIAEEASGPTYSVVRLCESLIEQGQHVTLAALDWSPMPSPPPFLKTFQLGWGPRRLGSSPAMRRWLEGQVQAGLVDVLHNHSLWMMPNVYPGQVVGRNGMPLIVSPRGTLSVWAKQSGSKLKHLFWPLLQRPALTATTLFHATSISEYEDIRRLGFHQPVAIIPNGIDIQKLLPQQPSAVRTLLFLGRIHPIKGLDLLLPAWQAVQDRYPDWQLRIVGPDNRGYLSDMQQLASELKLERVVFSGALFGQHKWQANQQAELFVLPTYSENFGMAVAEALAAGTPAIVSKGAPWAGLETHNAGWWIDIGLDPLIACLNSALSRTSIDLAQIGMRGRQWMADEYSWAYIGEQMSETYRWVIYGGKTPHWIMEQ